MKEVDDTEIPRYGTPVPESESETRRETDELLFECIKHLGEEVKEALEDRDEVIRGLMKRVANLEARKPPQDTNPDPEWY